MVEIGVLQQLDPFEATLWAAPSFGTPKKIGDICIIADFRKMNAWIQCKLFPLPHIAKQLQKLDNSLRELWHLICPKGSTQSLWTKEVKRYVPWCFHGEIRIYAFTNGGSMCTGLFSRNNDETMAEAQTNRKTPKYQRICILNRT